MACIVFWLETEGNVLHLCQLYQILVQKVSKNQVLQVHLKRESNKKIWCVLCACNLFDIRFNKVLHVVFSICHHHRVACPVINVAIPTSVLHAC